jgi:pimeloyl-ACP methyl ester carboxylesterase
MASGRDDGPSKAAQSRPRPGARTYILIHGAWHGGWVWGPVATSLRAEGHVVYAPSLTGLGDRKHLLRPGINLDTHADDIVNIIEMEGLQRVTLVGWSYGGMIVSEVVARVPEKIAAIVYLDAFAPERGRSLLSYSQRVSGIEEAVQDAMRGKDLAPLPFELMGVTDPEVIAFVAPRLTLHPVMTYLQASNALPERPDIPHTYILATRSPIVAFRPFFEMFRADGHATTHVVDADHLLMLTDPERTAHLLAGIS